MTTDVSLFFFFFGAGQWASAIMIGHQGSSLLGDMIGGRFTSSNFWRFFLINGFINTKGCGEMAI